MVTSDKNKDLIVIVPYRNRDEHLKRLLEITPAYFRTQGISFDILLCELDNVGDWNAGLCVNSLVKFPSIKDYKWIYVHHVDVWPIEGTWEFPKDKEVFFNLGDYGSCLLSSQAFFAVGGYSNMFWGWGGEDNDLYKRLTAAGYSLIDKEKSPCVTYDTTAQNHPRDFNGRNYASGLKNLYVTPRNPLDSVQNFSNFGVTSPVKNLAANIFHQKITPLHQSASEHKSKSLLLTYSYGETNFEKVAAFIKTACIYSAYSFDFVVVVGDQNPDPKYIEQLEAHGAKTFMCPLQPSENLFVSRYIAYTKFLKSNPQYEYVLHTDFYDVYFQADPYCYINCEKVLFVSEDLAIEKENWNKTMSQMLYGQRSYIAKPIICSGIFGAPATTFVEICKRIYAEYERLGNPNHHGVDQPILNKLIYVDDDILWKYRKIYTNQDAFCINMHVHCNNKPDAFCPIYIDNKIVKNCNKERFAIVHQYNREPELNTHIYNYFRQHFMPL